MLVRCAVNVLHFSSKDGGVGEEHHVISKHRHVRVHLDRTKVSRQFCLNCIDHSIFDSRCSPLQVRLNDPGESQRPVQDRINRAERHPVHVSEFGLCVNALLSMCVR
jgi:hypothetical protein